jgi:hypothetical protein
MVAQFMDEFWRGSMRRLARIALVGNHDVANELAGATLKVELARRTAEVWHRASNGDGQCVILAVDAGAGTWVVATLRLAAGGLSGTLAAQSG